MPPETPHRLIRMGDAPVRVRFVLRPALETEVLLETLFGLARDGRAKANGEPSLLQLAVIVDGLPELGRPTKPSPAIQKALFKLLAVLGRRRGLKARYPQYSGGG